ncbi:MAG: methylenetetrahydrofolate--tRNA-(uracil(54)-C(5))-methyltransferase (FADH(2)-oxidizing) TrmFO, partial [Planctomycetes bacterium]|nr:methylenetetrahydrofolate--tRNA-(uracil(54)-C(5))-methyltransferase (FADH(2)-oxidizing) TrmFO [Planctomycetota bacterium]
SPVHQTGLLAELVCSNSLRSDKLDNAVGLLKAEMRVLGSLVLRVADATRVPAGAALAVDRARFAEAMTEAVTSHPRISLIREEVPRIPPPSPDGSPVVLATGPLTSPSLAGDLARLVGQDALAFFDAISPIVLARTIDQTKVFRASRWRRSLRPGSSGAPAGRSPEHTADQVALDEGDYLNCPLDPGEYARFYDALAHAESAAVHDFDRTVFFEGCLPIEVMASRGPDTLRFGPMKPVGLVDPRTGRQPYAVVQLRQDNLAGDHFSLVGFQTQLRQAEQERVLRLIPGLGGAEFVRFGMVHRNTYINAPAVLTDTWQVRHRPDLFIAGQVSGVEGYVESAASGLLAGLHAVEVASGRTPPAPPRTTAIGALAYYVSHADAATYQPTKATFGIIAPLVSMSPRLRRDRLGRKMAMAERALKHLAAWQDGIGWTSTA